MSEQGIGSMESLRERFLIETGQDDGSALDHALSSAADDLMTKVLDRMHKETRIRHNDIGFWEEMALEFEGNAVHTIFASDVVPPEDIRKIDGYKKIHAEASDPDIDMAVEIVPGYRLRKAVSGEPLEEPMENVIIVILNQPYGSSSDAGIHLDQSEKPESRSAPSM